MKKGVFQAYFIGLGSKRESYLMQILAVVGGLKFRVIQGSVIQIELDWINWNFWALVEVRTVPSSIPVLLFSFL